MISTYMNLMNLYQEKIQDIKEFREQYIAMRKVCDELDLHFRKVQGWQKVYTQRETHDKPT